MGQRGSHKTGQPHSILFSSAGKHTLAGPLSHPCAEQDCRFVSPAGSGTWVPEQNSFSIAVKMKNVCLLAHVLGTECAEFTLSVCVSLNWFAYSS